jgi:thimet oligopeptidase
VLHDYTTTTVADVERVTSEALEQAGAEVRDAIDAVGPRTFENTLLPLDRAGTILWRAYGKGGFMARVHADLDVRDAGQQAEESIEKWQVGLTFRDDLAAAVRAYAETDEARGLSGERARFLEHWQRDFRRAGQELGAQDRGEVLRLRGRLVELSVAFQRNVDDVQDGLELTRDDLVGLDASYIDRLRPGATPGTYRVSLDYPELFPFLESSERRDLREQLLRKDLNKARDTNVPVLEEALRLRRRIAELLGYPSWAAYAIEVRMAKTPDAVDRFYEELVGPLTARAHGELEALGELLAVDTGSRDIQAWDWRHYDDQQRRRDYGVDQAQVSGYFPLDRVLDGMLALTGDVLGVDYERVADARAWHPDVMLYAMRDRASGRLLAHCYLDLFPREGKFGHAAAWTLDPPQEVPGRERIPAISAIVANFTKPSADAPSLLRHTEAVTLFHEFGHVLHQCLSRTELTRFAGTQTETDFVEAPSQIMENWTWDAEVLGRFARHFQTGEPIPAGLVGQLVAARDLNIALRTLRQCYFGFVDLGMHGPELERDLDAIYRRAWAVTALPFPEGTFDPASFAHVMGGYDAGYYGYLWSSVFGDDMFSRFAAEGVASPEVGAEYRREILERGGSRDADDLLRSFLGREPTNRAFLHRLGIDAAPGLERETTGVA